MSSQERNRLRNLETKKKTNLTDNPTSRHEMFAHIANAMFNVQRRLNIEYKCGVTTKNSFLLNYNTSKNFFPTIRKVILNKYGEWKDINVRSLSDDILAISEDEFVKTLLTIESPHLLPEPSVAAVSDCSGFRIRTATIATVVDQARWENVEELENFPAPIRVTDCNVDVTFCPQNLETLSETRNVYTAYRCLAETDGQVEINQRIVYDEGEFQTEVVRTSVSRGRTFDFLIYAPPNSGKSTVQQKIREGDEDALFWTFGSTHLYDTDNLFLDFRSASVTFTNMPNLIQASRFSVAVVPSESVFNARCRDRGLTVLNDWYSGMLRAAIHANVVIYTDKYLGEL